MADYDGGSASVRIRPNMSRFTTELDAELRRVQATVEVAARIGDIDDGELTAWRARQEADAVTVRVEADTSAMDRAITELDSSIGRLGGGGGAGGGGGLTALLPAAGILGMGSLPAAVSILADLAGAIQQVAGAGMVLPGVIGGIASTAVTAKLGFTGMGDALEAVNAAADGTPESLKKAQAALDELAPAAADVVNVIADIKPAWDDAVTDTFQQNMFADLAPQAKAAFDELFPTLKAGLGDISSAWNGTFSELLGAASSGSTQSFLGRIFGNTADAQRIANQAIDPLSNAIGNLTASGSDALPRLAYDLDSVANRFDKWISDSSSDGRLDDWINNGITGLEQLANSGVNIAQSIGGIADAADGDLLRSIEEVTGEWAEWLNSDEGQAELKQFIADGDALLSSMSGTVKNLGPEFKAAFDLSASSVGVLVTSIEGITGVLKAVEDKLPGFSESFKNALAGPLGMVNQLKSVLGNNPLATDLAQGNLDAALAAARANDPRTQPVIAPTAGGPAIGAPGPVQGPSVNQAPVVTRPGTLQEFLIPSRATGGLSDGPESGYPAILHGREFVQQADAVSKYGLPFMNALNEGKIDPSSLPGFSTGGGVDEHGNPITPGPLPGPATAGSGPLPPQQQAPGGLMSAFGSFLSGIQAPIGNALSLGQGFMGQVPGAGGGVPGMQTQHGLGTMLPGLSGGSAGGQSYGGFSNPMASIPGLFGLFGSLGGQNPGADLMQWGSNTGEWLGNFASNTAMKFGTTLWQGALGLVGMENSFLSPTNPYMQSMMEGLGYFGDLSGSMSGDQSGRSGSGAMDPKKFREAQDRITDRDAAVAIAEARLRELPEDAKESQRMAATGALDKARREAAQARMDFGSVRQGGSPALDLSALPHGVGSEQGLQINTIQTKRAVSAMFPGVTEIGGYREDALKWHPDGLAIDVMIDNWDTPEGKAYGDQIYAYVAANADALGVDLGATLWQKPDHYNHLHIATTGGGYPSAPGYSAGGAPRGIGGPTSDLIPALLSFGEHVFDAEDVEAMGGQDAVYAFRAALGAGVVGSHAAGGAPVLTPTQQQAWQSAMQHAPTPPKPNFDPGQSARPMNPARPAAPSAPAAGPAPAPGPAAPGAVPPPVAPGMQEAAAPAFTTNAPAPSSLNHNLKAIDTAIDSTAATLGNIAAQAASMGMGAAGGAVPGLGAFSGIASSAIQGGAKQIGNIAKGAVNVLSSAGVGTVTMGDPTAPVYGATAIGAQPQPWTMQAAQGRGRGDMYFQGYQPRDVIREMRVAESQDAQGNFANL